MKKRFFGTDGIRGCVGQGAITVPFMYRLGRAIGAAFSHQCARVLIARDTRISGASLQVALQAGLSSVGVASEALGVLPTPAVAFLAKQEKNTIGVMITASHNPYQDNGVKLFTSNGQKISDAMELEIEKHLLAASVEGDSKAVGTVVDKSHLAEMYVDYCMNVLGDNTCFQSLKVVVDCANGATVSVAQAIFSKLLKNVTFIHVEPNGVNINLECGATNLKSLKTAVVESQADCGIAFDGDGDRLMMVDHLGRVVDGDQILAILVQAEASSGSLPGVVGTLMTNLGFEQLMAQHGIPFKRAKVGDRYVLEVCHHEGWSLGGESSGHIINLKYATTGDAILSALQVLTAMGKTGRSLELLASEMRKHPQVLVNVAVNEVVEMDKHPELQREIEAVTCRLGDRGRVLVRPSGTESCVRVMVEGVSSEEIHQCANELKVIVENHLCSVTA